MFKTREELIVIQAEATTPIPTGVVFWSHDKGTAKLIIQLKKDHINQTLPQGTTVPILLEFNSDTAAKGKGRHIYHAVIENALEGIVSIVLEDNILGYVGRVDGSVYIELPDSRSLDTAGRFSFDVKRSPIDDDVPELEDYYWQGFSEINKEFVDMKKKLDKAIIDFGGEKNEIVKEFHRKFTEVNTALSTALTEFEKGNFYPKPEADDLFFSSEDLATEKEAEAGEDNTKPMTPLRVSQAISKWVANKFISLSGNDTISGTKDFVGNLLVNKKRVLTVDDLPSDSVNLSVVNGNSGNARLYWQGKSVTIYFTALNGKSSGGNDSTILTIPEGYRPPTGFEKLIGSIDRSALNSAQISIGADGVVRWRRNSNYASDYTFEVTFVRA